jgi:hypothetical protein
MKYTLRDYQGLELTISSEQAAKIANVAELIEIQVAGQTHYVNAKNIASIKPAGIAEPVAKYPALSAPDHRGEHSPAKEAILRGWANGGVSAGEL